MTISETLQCDGFAILPGAVDRDTVAGMREVIAANLRRMANTRPNPASRHLAGFHRVPTLEGLHREITANAALNAALAEIYAPFDYITIGLTDITVNRSQPWHTDLLRGKYAGYLTPDMCWGDPGPGCLKALLYLQDGASLKVRPGSHRRRRALTSDNAAVPRDAAQVRPVAVSSGDIVLMDIRLVHRGSTEEEMARITPADAPKILVSTVFGRDGADLTRAMQLGNMHRMIDWEARHFAGVPQRSPHAAPSIADA